MPELPEVETMVRGIRPFVEGRRVREIVACRCRCRPITVTPKLPRIAKALIGRRVEAVRRRGKRCVLEFDGGDGLVFEPRMTGLLLLSDPPNREHLRIEVRFAGRREFNSLWFWDQRGLGTVQFFTREQMLRLMAVGKLGLDALEMTDADWQAKCGSTSRAIKVALLDQKVAAGIGNLYASEILHRARIHPQEPADRLTRDQLRRMATEVRVVLEEAIRYEGSTLGDGTYRNALNHSGSYQNEHRVYQRADELCLACGETPIQRIVQAQRATFFCPACQPLNRKRKRTGSR